jgi:hypothetical protein
MWFLRHQGVFLWVRLVVVSLLAGMRHGDRFSDLQRRLDLLPDRLEDLYMKILQSLDPFYLEHAAQLFGLVQECIDPPPLLLLPFVDAEGSEFALKKAVQPLLGDQLNRRLDTLRRRLNSCCKGLLEVGRLSMYSAGPSDASVQYLHRTVKDFVESSKVQEKLQSATKSTFDPHLRICVGSVAHCKSLHDNVDFLADGSFWTRIQRCLYSAARILPGNRRTMVPLLDELDRSCSVLAKRLSQSQSTWSLLDIGRDDSINELLAVGQWVPSQPLRSEDQFRCSFLSWRCVVVW